MTVLAKLVNPSGRMARQWADVVIPHPEGAPAPQTPWGYGVIGQVGSTETQKVLAMRGQPHGEGFIWQVQAELQPGTHELREIIAMPGWAPKLVISDWVSDDWGALMPEIHVNMADGRHLTSAPPQVYTEDYSNALKIVLVRLRIPEIMLTHDQWAYVYSDQDMVPVEMRTQFGDTNQPDVSLAATKIWLRSGEYLHLDYGKRKGIGSHGAAAGPRSRAADPTPGCSALSPRADAARCDDAAWAVR
jgi:hypothetical protein